MGESCPACGGGEIRGFVDLGEAPALIGSLWDDAGRARTAPRGRLDLVACRACGHVWNQAFDAGVVDYDADYDNSLHHSPTFQRFADELADQLAVRHDLGGKFVLEIGSGKGEFLAALCSRGGCEGTGYDPSFAGTTDTPGVELVNEYFPVGSVPHRPFDLLVCRHVLEHLADPLALLTGLATSARATGGRPTFYVEVPSASFNFGPAGLWDCIHPHVSYFCRSSLRRLIERAGLSPVRLDESFHGQFLAAEAVPSGRPAHRSLRDEAAVEAHLAVLDTFAQRLTAAVDRWSRRIGDQQSSGERIALWGAGAKGVVFLNAVDRAGRLRAVVDVNPTKWGRFLPGTGHQVVPPAELSRGVDTVLVTNPAYLDEIRSQLVQLGARADVLAV